MIRNTLMTFGVGVFMVLFFSSLTGCLLFLSSGAAVMRSSQSIVVTPLVFNDAYLKLFDDENDVEISVLSSNLVDSNLAWADSVAGKLLPFLASFFVVNLLNAPLKLANFILVSPVIDGSDPSYGFYP